MPWQDGRNRMIQSRMRLSGDAFLQTGQDEDQPFSQSIVERLARGDIALRASTIEEYLEVDVDQDQQPATLCDHR